MADATAPPLTIQGYDLVRWALGIFFFPDPVTGTEHLMAQARPGGRAALTIWRRGAIEPVGRHLPAALLPWEPHPVDWAQAQQDAAISRIDTLPTFAQWLGARGLHRVLVHTHSHTADPPATVAWDLVIGSGFRALLEGLNPAQVDRVRQASLQELAAHGVDWIDATTLIGTGRTTP